MARGDKANDGAMARRRFLSLGAKAGAALAASGIAIGPDWSAARVELDENGAARRAPRSHDFEIDEITIAELQEAMRLGRRSAASIAELYLRRIEDVDRRGPTLRSVIEINPDAIATARTLDAERKARGPRGPLHGIPVLLKDNIDTADRMSTSAGSLALADATAREDAFLVARLRDAGAVILGKANLSEWANFRSTHSSSGWSARGGQTRNPYVLDRNPCGSSSGSAAAVSANLTAVAVGTETDGSVVCPSSTCGIVGVKPTLGLVSRSGIVPIAHSQDTAGPMARTVTDAAILLGAMAGGDARDRATVSSAARRAPDYTRFLDGEPLAGVRIGVARNFFGFSSSVDHLMEEAIGRLQEQGATLIDPANLTTSGKYDDSELEVLLFEFKADLNAYLARAGDGAAVRSLEELIRFNEEHRDREMPYFGQELFVQAEAKGPLTTPAYRRALAKNLRLSRAQGIDAVMDRKHLDALFAPTGGPAWVTDLINGDHYTGGSSTPAAVAGYPSVTVPAGFVQGLPVGVSFFGRAWTEPTLLRIAFAYEQASHARRKPSFADRMTY